MKTLNHSESQLQKQRLARTRLASMRRVSLASGAFLALAMSSSLSAQEMSIHHKYGNSAGATQGGLAIAALQPGWVVTAVCNGTGLLEIISWNDSGVALVRKGSKVTELACDTTQSVAITSFNSTTVVTAHATPISVPADPVELAAWNVDVASGAISQIGQTGFIPGGSTTQPAQSVSISHVPDTSFVVTAFLGSDLVNAGANWFNLYSNLVPTTATESFNILGNVGLPAECSANLCQDGNGVATVVAGLNSNQVLTATARYDNSHLEVDSWAIDSTGYVTHQNDATAGYVGNPQIAAWTSNTAVTSFVNGSGDLEIISWGVNSNGTVTRLANGQAGEAGSPALCLVTVTPFGSTPFSAVAGGSGLSVETWDTNAPTDSVIYEKASYNTSWAQTPTSCAPINGGLVVTAATAGNQNDVALNEWAVGSNIIP